MGDRVSISFANEDEESICLYSHWSGRKLVDLANRLSDKFHYSIPPNNEPYLPADPNKVMLYFIMRIAKSKKLFARIPKRYMSGWEKVPVKDTYLNLQTDKCCEDNGHYTIRLDKHEIKHEGGSNVCYDCGADFDDPNAECTEECLCYNFDCLHNHMRDNPDCTCQNCSDERVP